MAELESESVEEATFSKRRCGLNQTVKKLCYLTHEEAAVLIVSGTGKAYGFGHPHFRPVLTRYISANKSEFSQLDVAAPPPTEAEARIYEAITTEKPAWDAITENLGLSDLIQLEEAVAKIKNMVAEQQSSRFR